MLLQIRVFAFIYMVSLFVRYSTSAPTTFGGNFQLLNEFLVTNVFTILSISRQCPHSAHVLSAKCSVASRVQLW